LVPATEFPFQETTLRMIERSRYFETASKIKSLRNE